MILHTEGPTEALHDNAKEIVDLISTVYPGHPWAVRCDKGFIFIRHLAFGSNWGMNLRVKEADHDAAVLKKKLVMLAGEWLERAGMKRGRYDPDQETYRVEGVPEHFQPRP